MINFTLEVKELSKQFGGVRAVDGVSFIVEPGEIVAVIGPNGAGKTTVFNLISGIFPATSGEIWLQDKRIDKLPGYQIAKLGIARTFQNLQVFEGMNVLENVMVGRHNHSRVNLIGAALRWPGIQQEERQARSKASQRLEFVGLAERARDNGVDLPYGQQRMLEIARALAAEPKLLLLDEPAAGLGSRETQDLATLVRRIRDQGITVLLIEHDMGMVMNIADRIIVLDYGKMLAQGTSAQIRNDQRVIAAYLGETVE